METVRELAKQLDDLFPPPTIRENVIDFIGEYILPLLSIFTPTTTMIIVLLWYILTH